MLCIIIDGTPASQRAVKTLVRLRSEAHGIMVWITPPPPRPTPVIIARLWPRDEAPSFVFHEGSSYASYRPRTYPLLSIKTAIIVDRRNHAAG